MGRRRRASVAAVTAVAATMGGFASTSASADPASGPSRTIVVDDDRAQCAKADHTTIAAALAEAVDGDRVRVCAGRYAERLVITDSIELRGDPSRAESLPCLDSVPAAPDDLKGAGVAVLEPPPGLVGPLLRIEANDVEVAGLVVQGKESGVVAEPVPGATLYDPAVQVDESTSGVRLHHNLFRLNTLAVEIGGSGPAPQRVDHNCFGDNDFGVANQRYLLTGLELDHNTSVRTLVVTYEVGWFYRAVTKADVHHNTAVETATIVVALSNNNGSIARDNDILGGSIRVIGGRDVVVRHNRISDNDSVRANGGVVVNPSTNQPGSVGVTVEENVITSLSGTPGTGIFVSLNSRSTGLVIRRNEVTDNRGEGIGLGIGVTGVRIEDNTVLRNAVLGIGTRLSTSGNTIAGNTVLGNGVDARDQAWATAPASAPPNAWVGNTCVTDDPAGLIC
ncbi:MAG TPA: right-handed parallel beta-helix repeat-containing protein [Nocardioides sp.]|nr:right-handed parallel beta-helix repeat-containing protein [Nocardioides sp.]